MTVEEIGTVIAREYPGYEIVEGPSVDSGSLDGKPDFYGPEPRRDNDVATQAATSIHLVWVRPRSRPKSAPREVWVSNEGKILLSHG